MNELKYGWLSSTGEFIECRSWEHYEAADKLYKQVFHVEEVPFEDLFMEEERLYDVGWIKISRSIFDNREWYISGKKIWSDEQYNFLKPYILTGNISMGFKCLVEMYEDGFTI